MPNYVMLNQPNKLQWLENAASQTGNFLYQLALAKVAHNWRMEEQDRQLEAKKIETQAERKFSGLQKGIVPAKPEEEGAVDIGGGQFFKQREAVIGQLGGRTVIIQPTGEVSLAKSEPSETGKYKPGELKDFKIGEKIVYGEYTGKPQDQFGGIQGWKNTGVEAPRQSQDIKITMDMTQATKSDLQKEIITGASVLDRLNRTDQLYSPEFSEYAGRGRAWLEEKASKLGMTSKGTPTKNLLNALGHDEKWYQNYSKWETEVDQGMLLWRKFITGVAGGPREMSRIEEVTLNTKDSPERYQAKKEQIKLMTEAAMKRSEWLLENWGAEYQKVSPAVKARIEKEVPLEKFGYKPATNTAKDKYEVGAIYEGNEGGVTKKKRYKGNGKWEDVQ